MKLLFLILFLLSLLLETTYTTIPFVFLLILFFALVFRELWIFVAAFLAGIVMDFLTFRNLGLTSMFLISFIFLVTVYERKFEIFTLPFVIISSFFGSFMFLKLSGVNDYIIWQSLISTLISILVFGFLLNFKIGSSGLIIETK